MIKKGDKVIYVGDSRGLKGTIVDVEADPHLWAPSHATVEWEDTNVFPRQMRIPVVDLKLQEPQSKASVDNNMDGCDCGLKYCRDGGKHSDWCSLAKKGWGW